MTCFPALPLDVFKFYWYQYGIPTSIILGLLVGIIIVAIYVRTRSIIHLSVMSIYAFAVFSSMWVNDSYLEAQYHLAVYVVAVGIASGITMMVMRLGRE